MKRTVWMMALALAMPSFVHAQPGAVVQPLPSAAAVETLNQNLARLSRNPRDVDALLGAGQAALDLGDMEAANGFYTRANLVNPNLGKAKLGLAIVELALKQPTEAAANFDAADALGERAQDYLADRGLAYDLTGQQAKAQRDYMAALRANPSDSKARLRYAVSLGISGQIAAADKQLEPVLASGDREAWRLRAFILAMNGKQAEARKITQSVMPRGLADALDPYMVRVPLLTPAQKAAAAHFGDFPANVLRLAAPNPATEIQVAEAPKRETGKKERNRRDRNRQAAEQASAAPVAPSGEPMLTPPPPPLAPPQQQSMAFAEPPRAQAPASSRTPAPATSIAQTTQSWNASAPPARPVATPTPAPVQSRPVQATVPTRGPADPSATVPPRPVSSAPQVVAPAPAPTSERRSLAETLSGLDVPEAERARSATRADMTAVAKIQEDRRKAEQDRLKKEAAAKAKAEADAKAKAEAERKAKLKANPARIWVQIAAGKNVDALSFDMRRLRKSYSDAIGDQAGWTADWGQTNRLLVGPFKKADAAKDVVSKIAKSGGDAFVWQSDAGEEVAKIGGK